MKKVNVFTRLFVVFSFCVMVLTFAAVQASAQTNECSASFDSQSNTLHVPCFSLDNQSFWLDLRLISADPIQFQLTNFGENVPSSYYEVYGAQAGDYNLNTTGHQLVGTSNSGNTFNLSGYERFIIYVPPSSTKILFDALGLGSGWVNSAPGPEYAHYTNQYMEITGGTWSQNYYFIEGPPDGQTMENTPGQNSYYGFSLLGASTLTVYLK